MLVVEDQSDDVDLFNLACDQAKVTAPRRFVSNGEEAVRYLQGEGEFADRQKYPLPRLLVLDLNLPLMNGFQVLEWLRLQPGLRRLVVIIFSSSDLPEDVSRAFDLGANSYVVKPGRFEEFLRIVRSLEDYWFKLNLCANCRDEPTSGPVRVLLRNPLSGQYYQSADAWTGDPEQALNFECSERAVIAARTLKLRDFEIIVHSPPERTHARKNALGDL